MRLKGCPRVWFRAFGWYDRIAPEGKVVPMLLAVKIIRYSLYSALLSLVLSTLVPLQASASGGNATCETSNFSGGNGTQLSPYGISDADELKELGDCIASANNWSSGKYFQLSNDIDLANASWRPLGVHIYGYQTFKGTFDGQGFRILNLNANASNSPTNNVTTGRGLFWYLEGGTIKNLEIHGSMTVAQYANHGVVAVRAAGGTITGVTTKVSISCGNFSNSSGSIGGLVGETVASSTLTISNTRVLVADSNPGINCSGVQGFGVSTNTLFVGGLVGHTYNTSKVFASSVSVEIPISAKAHNVRIGGLVGGQTSGHGTGGKITIANSIYSGALSLSSGTANAEIGGAVGFAESKEVDIDGFVSTGTINLLSSKNYRIGGVVGVLANLDNTYKSHIKNSYASMDISFEHSGTATEGAIGGLVGEQVAGTVRNTWSTGEINQGSGTALANLGSVIGKLTGSDTSDTNFYNFFDAESYPTEGPYGGAAPEERPATRSLNYRKIYEDERSVLATFSTSNYFSIANFPDNGGSTLWLLCDEPFLRWQGSVASCLPRIIEAAVTASGEAISVTFSRPINHDGTSEQGFPPASVFSATVNGGATNVTSIARGADPSNKSLVLTLDKKVASTDTISLSYTAAYASSSSPDVLEDVLSGEDLPSFINFPVSNSSTLGPRIELLTGGFVASYTNFGATTQIRFQVNECPGVTFDPSAVLEVRVDGQAATIPSQTITSAGCDLSPPNGFTVNVNQKIFRDQTITIAYMGDSTGVNGPSSLVSSNGLTYATGTLFTVTNKAFAVWRPVLSASALVSASSAIQMEFQTYGEGLAFSKTAGTTTFGTPHPLYDHFTISGAVGTESPTISGSVLTVPLANTIYQGDSLSIVYSDPNPGTNDDLDGLLEMAVRQTFGREDAKPFTITIDTSNAPSQPDLVSATLSSNGRALALVFTEDLAGTLPSASVLMVTVDGNAVTLSSMVRSVALNTLALSLQTAVVMPGSTVVVSYTDPTSAVEDPPSLAIGSAAGDWDAKTFSVTATNSSTRVTPVADASLTATANSITATASCQSGCSGASPDAASYELFSAGNPVGVNTTGLFTGLSASTAYVIEVSVSYDGLISATTSKSISTQAQTPAPSPTPTPTPTPTPAPTISPVITQSPVVTQSPTATASPEPTTSPAPSPVAAPTPTPEVTPVAIPQPSSTPTSPASPSPNLSPTPAPSPEPEASGETDVTSTPTPTPTETSIDVAAEIPRDPNSQTLVVEDISSGAISLQSGEEAVILTAALLEDVVFRLAPLNAPLEEGTLQISTEIRSIEILVLELANVTFTAAEIGSFIEFTLMVPGFEANSLRVIVEKDDLEQTLWVLSGLLFATLIGGSFVFLLIRRRKSEAKNNKSLDPSNPASS